VVDGASGFGNGRVLPAGPLREPISAGEARCDVAVLIGDCTSHAARALSIPVLRARLVPGPEITALVARPVLAFAGIAVPEKFFATLRDAGVTLAASVAFPDHHAFTDRELSDLLARARQLDAMPVTTAKDAVRLPAAMRHAISVVGVTLAWDDPSAIDTLLLSLRGA
jgi:tetraacyldisaccharide 4'-kinase